MKAMLHDSIVYLYLKSGSNQTGFMPKLRDEQLNSNVSTIKVMV